MLQQTRVDQATPYFERFLTVFPDVQTLASSSIDDVLLCWEGLGYYRRAHNLHSAANVIVANYGGTFPSALNEVLALPGVGKYTAAAIVSIAFGEPVAAVDGNVLRVLSRVFGMEEDIKSTSGHRSVQNLAQRVLSREHPGDTNQAVMELGATVCRPKSPDCGACPLNDVCMAHRHNMTDLIPVTTPRKPTPHHTIAVGVVRDDTGRVLMVQRPKDRLLGGLWEFPGARLETGESVTEACARGIRDKLGLDVIPDNELVCFGHQYSHFRITVHALHCGLAEGDGVVLNSAPFRWLHVAELSKVAMHKSSRRISSLIASTQTEPASSIDVH